MGLEPCSNCASAYFASQTADSYGVTTQSNAPRWLLLAGAVLLLLLLCLVVSQRTQAPAVLSANAPVPPTMATQSAPMMTVTTRPTTSPSPDPDAEFWRQKSIRELREAGEYVPTKEEMAYRDRVRTWSHFSTADDARAADYYMRRPETFGRR